MVSRLVTYGLRSKNLTWLIRLVGLWLRIFRRRLWGKFFCFSIIIFGDVTAIHWCHWSCVTERSLVFTVISWVGRLFHTWTRRERWSQTRVIWSSSLSLCSSSSTYSGLSSGSTSRGCSSVADLTDITACFSGFYLCTWWAQLALSEK